MSIVHNNSPCSSIFYNNTELSKVYFNNTLVFQRECSVTIQVEASFRVFSDFDIDYIGCLSISIPVVYIDISSLKITVYNNINCTKCTVRNIRVECDGVPYIGSYAGIDYVPYTKNSYVWGGGNGWGRTISVSGFYPTAGGGRSSYLAKISGQGDSDYPTGNLRTSAFSSFRHRIVCELVVEDGAGTSHVLGAILGYSWSPLYISSSFKETTKSSVNISTEKTSY